MYFENKMDCLNVIAYIDILPVGKMHTLNKYNKYNYIVTIVIAFDTFSPVNHVSFATMIMAN